MVKTLYENILRLCKAHGISVARLEIECKLGNATIRGWNESSPRVNNLKAVADYFGVTVDELLKENA